MCKTMNINWSPVKEWIAAGVDRILLLGDGIAIALTCQSPDTGRRLLLLKEWVAAGIDGTPLLNGGIAIALTCQSSDSSRGLLLLDAVAAIVPGDTSRELPVEGVVFVRRSIVLR